MRRKMSSTQAIAVGLLLACMLAVSCKKETAAPAEGSKGPEPQNVQYTVGTIPAGFPEDIPVYKNISSSKAINGGANLLHLQSGDSRKQITEFYRKELTAAQWQLTEENTDERDEILASKQQRRVTVSIRDKGTGGRVIDITY